MPLIRINLFARNMRKIAGSVRLFINRILWKNKRTKKIRYYLLSHKIKKLQIGTDRFSLDGWLNTDYNLRIDKNLVYLDATDIFPFENETFDFVFNEHFIEHISLQDGEKFLSECFRILKPGGKIRIATPDLSFFIGLFSPNLNEKQKKFITWSQHTFLPEIKTINAGYIINNHFYNWGHQFIYSEFILSESLKKSGFININRCKVRESIDHELCNLEQRGKWTDHELNDLETMIIEAQKPI